MESPVDRVDIAKTLGLRYIDPARTGHRACFLVRASGRFDDIELLSPATIYYRLDHLDTVEPSPMPAKP